MSLTLVVAALLGTVSVALGLFVAAGTVHALAILRRPRPLPRPPGAGGLTRRGFLVLSSRRSTMAVGALLAVRLVGIRTPAHGQTQGPGQCTSCVYGQGSSCDQAVSEVFPGCRPCPPKQGYQVCSQSCFAC